MHSGVMMIQKFCRLVRIKGRCEWIESKGGYPCNAKFESARRLLCRNDEFLGGFVCVLTPEVLGGATSEINFKLLYYIFRRCFMRDLSRFVDYFDTIYGKIRAPSLH